MVTSIPLWVIVIPLVFRGYLFTMPIFFPVKNAALRSKKTFTALIPDILLMRSMQIDWIYGQISRPGPSRKGKKYETRAPTVPIPPEGRTRSSEYLANTEIFIRGSIAKIHKECIVLVPCTQGTIFGTFPAFQCITWWGTRKRGVEKSIGLPTNTNVFPPHFPPHFYTPRPREATAREGGGGLRLSNMTHYSATNILRISLDIGEQSGVFFPLSVFFLPFLVGKNRNFFIISTTEFLGDGIRIAASVAAAAEGLQHGVGLFRGGPAARRGRCHSSAP